MIKMQKRSNEYYYIYGETLKVQRKAAGLSLRQLCDLIKCATKRDYITINGSTSLLSKMTIWRMERMHEIALEPATALVIKKIFEL